MKRILAVFLCLAMAMCLAACTGNNPGGKDDPDPYRPDGEGEVISSVKLEDWPRVDGATAFLPFYRAAAAKLLGMSEEDADRYIECSTTDFAYPKLFNKETDMVFCLAPSDAQIEQARDMNVEVEGVPFLNEGFVFFVNENNPVDSLTIAQLHDIYAGKITNWKELGGNDEKILAYQRTEGSGSQTGLYLHVISEDEVMAPISDEMIASSMFGIVDLASHYDNSSAAIGYSYYYFVNTIDYDENIKCLKIDGVEPNAKTISSGEYPMISKVYAMYRKSEPADSMVRKIAWWCASKTGQELAASLGYVTNDPLVAETMVIQREQKNRTMPAAIDTCYKAAKNNIVIEKVIPDWEGGMPSSYTVGEGCEYIRISGLRDKAVENKVNNKIKEVFYSYFGEEPYVPPYRGSKLHTGKYTPELNLYFGAVSNRDNILSVIGYLDYNESDYYSYYSGEYIPLNFDLRTGELLSITDLFTDAQSGIDYLDTQVEDYIDKYGSYDEYDQEFRWIVGDAVLFDGKFKGISPDQRFTVDEKSNSLVLYFDYRTPEVFTETTPVYMTISLDNVCDLNRKFMSRTALYEDANTEWVLLEAKTHSAKYKQGASEYWAVMEEDGHINYSYSDGYCDSFTDSQNEIMHYSYSVPYNAGTLLEMRRGYYGSARYDDIYAWVDGSGDCGSVGPYDWINSRETARLEYNDGEDIWVWDGSRRYCYKHGSDEELYFSDLLQPGLDGDYVLKEAIRKSLCAEESDLYGDYYVPFTNYVNMAGADYDELYEELMDYYGGFSVGYDCVRITYTCDSGDIFDKYLPEGANGGPYMYWDRITEISFKDIGYENLCIFDEL